MQVGKNAEEMRGVLRQEIEADNRKKADENDLPPVREESGLWMIRADVLHLMLMLHGIAPHDPRGAGAVTLQTV
jgi:hypothetical protein